MYSEFEEKTYESSLINELVRTKRIFSPGQVLENIVGFDVALRTNNNDLWRLFPHISPMWQRWLFMYPHGIALDGDWLKALAAGMQSAGDALNENARQSR